MAEKEKTLNGEVSKPEASTEAEAAKQSKSDNGHGESGLALVSSQGNGGKMQVSTFSSAGLRPIASSNLEIADMILNNRPIMASHLKVLNYAIPGHRPVFASDIMMRDDLTLPGGRPIVASNPKLLEASLLPGGRPIASNEIDDSETLMGFID